MLQACHGSRAGSPRPRPPAPASQRTALFTKPLCALLCAALSVLLPSRGALVPDEVVVDMVKGRMAQPDVAQRGWLLDGYPRSASQAEAIEKVDIRPDVFILINVPDSILIGACVRAQPVT